MAGTSGSAGDCVETDVLVVGAGPAGLATAGSLIESGLRPELIEKAADVGASWRGHYRRLHLHTVKELSALPHLPFPAHFPRYVARDQVIQYLEAYQRHFGIAPRFGQAAVSLTRAGDRWETVCASGLRLRSTCVVLATGANQMPHVPQFAGREGFCGQVLHSASYHGPEPFAGQRVLVVGMGNTGAEIALDLAQHGVAATLAIRSPVNIVHRDVLGRPTQRTSIALAKLPHRLGDAVAGKLRDLTVGDLSRWGIATPKTSPLRQLREEGRTPVIDVGTLALIKAGAIAVRPGMISFTADGVRFTDGRTESFDAVILATGYRPGVAALVPAAGPELDGRGLPASVAGRGALDGLYFVGFDLRQPGGVLRSIAAQAREVAAAVRSRLSQSPGSSGKPGAPAPA